MKQNQSDKLFTIILLLQKNQTKYRDETCMPQYTVILNNNKINDSEQFLRIGTVLKIKNE